jgi:hypothetical protein
MHVKLLWSRPRVKVLVLTAERAAARFLIVVITILSLVPSLIAGANRRLVQLEHFAALSRSWLLFLHFRLCFYPRN